MAAGHWTFNQKRRHGRRTPRRKRIIKRVTAFVAFQFIPVSVF